MTASFDIHVILPGEGQASSPRRALRAANGSMASAVVVVVPGDDEARAAELARAVQGDADVVVGGRGSFAARRAVLAAVDVTEDWPVVGYEVAAQVAAGGGRVEGLDGSAGRGPARIRLRWSGPAVWRRQRLARRRAPESWDASDSELASTLDNLDAATNYADWIVSLMAPYLRGRILEVGAGHGTFTSLLAQFGPVTATELSERAVAVLRERYAGSDAVTVAHVDELTETGFDTCDHSATTSLPAATS
jgi:hypothetical protein